MNIVYTLNDNFVPQVGAGIVSVCENNKKFKIIHFFLISSGISDGNKKELIKLVNSYGREIDIIELGDIDQYFDFEFDTNGWNPIVLARLLLDKILPSKSEPPVDAFAFKIIAVPIPIRIPPYILANNLSSVTAFTLSNRFKNRDNSPVPIIAFVKKLFPSLKKDIKNKGKFNKIIPVPIGNLNR